MWERNAFKSHYLLVIPPTSSGCIVYFLFFFIQEKSTPKSITFPHLLFTSPLPYFIITCCTYLLLLWQIDQLIFFLGIPIRMFHKDILENFLAKRRAKSS